MKESSWWLVTKLFTLSVPGETFLTVAVVSFPVQQKMEEGSKSQWEKDVSINWYRSHVGSVPYFQQQALLWCRTLMSFGCRYRTLTKARMGKSISNEVRQEPMGLQTHNAFDTMLHCLEPGAAEILFHEDFRDSLGVSWQRIHICS